MSLYAYYKPGEREETLERHVIAGLRYLEELYIKFNYHLHVSKRLMVEPSEAELFLKATYALHDIGKAYKPFQDMIRSGRGAPGHEILSAIVVVKGLNVDLYAKRGIALSILLHHHAMRPIGRAILEALKSKKYTLPNNGLRLLSTISSIVEVEVKPVTAITVRELKEIIISDIAKLLSVEKLQDSWKVHTLAYLALHPLITCDALAAATAKYECDSIRCLESVINTLPPWIRDYLLSHPTRLNRKN